MAAPSDPPRALDVVGELRIDADGVPLRVRARGGTVTISPERLRDVLRLAALRRRTEALLPALTPWLTRADVTAEVRVLGVRVARLR